MTTHNSLPKRVGALVALLLLSFTIAPNTAQAAQVDGAITRIDATVTGGSSQLDGLSPYGSMTTNIDWTVPPGAQPGDTFTLTLPENLCCGVGNFPLRDSQGNVVANAAVTSGGDNGADVITFTYTDYIATRQNVSGTAFFQSSWEQVGDRWGTSETLSYSVNGTVFHTETATFQEAPVGGPPSEPFKYGYFNSQTDQCHTNPDNCLTWVLVSGAGPFDSATITDTLTGGVTIDTADCGNVFVEALDAQGNVTRFLSAGEFQATCADTSIRVVTPSAGQGVLYRVSFAVNVPLAADPSRAISYTNEGNVTRTVNGQPNPSAVSSEIRSSGAGGQGSGDNIDIEKFDAAGNDADTAAGAVNVPTGGAQLSFRVSNTGDRNLTDVTVSDAIIEGSATVTGLTCSFPDGSTGVAWAGPFTVGDDFTCSATLSGVAPGATHADRASVSATGNGPVSDTDEYHATRGADATTTTLAATTTTGAGSGGVPPTTGAQSTTSTIAVVLPPGAPPTSAAGVPRPPGQLPATGGSMQDPLLAASMAVVAGWSLLTIVRRWHLLQS
jgi:Bacterial Ig domain